MVGSRSRKVSVLKVVVSGTNSSSRVRVVLQWQGVASNPWQVPFVALRGGYHWGERGGTKRGGALGPSSTNISFGCCWAQTITYTIAMDNGPFSSSFLLLMGVWGALVWSPTASHTRYQIRSVLRFFCCLRHMNQHAHCSCRSHVQKVWKSKHWPWGKPTTVERWNVKRPK